ncbi:MAG: phosphatidate cytidylyltransferase [Alphaproteobacteria bacterium]
MADRARHELRLRVISAGVLAPVAVAAALAGGLVFAGIVLVIALGLAWEWGNLVAAPAWGNAVAVVAAWLAAVVHGPVLALTVLVIAAAAVWAILRHAVGPSKAGWTAGGALYIGVPAVAILALRARPEDGAILVIGVMLAVWSTDTAAFLVGRAVGGPRLAPGWSPGKTWAGAIGGVLGAGVVAALGIAFDFAKTPLLFIALVIVLSIVSQLGDLAESVIKRHFGRKDSGAVIPGHGGLFDRLDSLLVAAPVLALVMALGGPGSWLVMGVP